MTDSPETVGKEMPGEKAIEMAEMALIHHDLNTCTSSLRIIKERYLGDNLSEEDRKIKLALFRDAVNLYVSAFVGSGHKLDQTKVYAETEGGEEFFEWMWGIRNSYAAHTFGAARQCVTAILIDPKTGKTAGVGPLRMDMDIVGLETVNEMGKASMVAAKYAQQIGEALNAELLAEAEQLSPDALAGLPNAQLHVPAPDEMRMERHRFRAIKTGQTRPAKRTRPKKRRELDRSAEKSETL